MAENYVYGQNIGMSQIVAFNWQTGGTKNVFVQDYSNPMDYVPKGGVFVTKFEPGDKVYQGDLCEFSLLNRTIKVLRTFVVAKNVTDTDTEILLKRNGYLHIPHTGMNLMKAPSALDGTGAAGAITNVVATTDGVLGDVYSLTIAANALGVLTAGDILVEAVEAGAGKAMYVTNPNTFIKNDLVFNFIQNTSPIDGNVVNGAILNYAPIQHAKCWKALMSPMPACVLAINKSRIDALFEL